MSFRQAKSDGPTNMSRRQTYLDKRETTSSNPAKHVGVAVPFTISSSTPSKTKIRLPFPSPSTSPPPTESPQLPSPPSSPLPPTPSPTSPPISSSSSAAKFKSRLKVDVTVAAAASGRTLAATTTTEVDPNVIPPSPPTLLPLPPLIRAGRRGGARQRKATSHAASNSETIAKKDAIKSAVESVAKKTKKSSAKSAPKLGQPLPETSLESLPETSLSPLPERADVESGADLKAECQPPKSKKAKNERRIDETLENREEADEALTPKRKSRIKEEKICWVCGDKALGFNFDAISCESCKAFFRRNAHKNYETWVCVYDSKCEINVKSRRFCQLCRLEKCFRVGMRKEWILKDDEKQERKEKILKNKEVIKPVKREESQQWEGSLSPSSVDDDANSVSSQDIATKRPLSNDNKEILESIMLNFQLTVMRHIQILRQEKKPLSNEKFDSMYDVLNATHEIVRGFIRFAKTLKPFIQLSQEDQIELLKGGMIECIIFSSAMMFDIEKRCWKDSNLNASILVYFNNPQTLPDVDIAGVHSKFMLTLFRDPQPDNTSIIILMVVCLFAGDRPHLSAPAKDFIDNWQQRYTRLLSQYLSSVYDPAEASLLQARLLMALTSVRSLHSFHSRLHLDMNQEQIDPLLVEVFDINRILKGATSSFSAASSSDGRNSDEEERGDADGANNGTVEEKEEEDIKPDLDKLQS